MRQINPIVEKMLYTKFHIGWVIGFLLVMIGITVFWLYRLV